MTYRGRIRNGQIVLDDAIELPEGTEVLVEAAEPKPRSTLAERFRGVIGTVPDLPHDMARQHDHYVNGTPRQ